MTMVLDYLPSEFLEIEMVIAIINDNRDVSLKRKQLSTYVALNERFSEWSPVVQLGSNNQHTITNKTMGPQPGQQTKKHSPDVIQCE